MRVTISALGLFWAHRAAQVAQQNGYLRHWITGAPDYKRHGVDPSLTRYLPIPTYLRYGIERLLPGSRGQYIAINVGDNLFDLLATRYATDCDIFHAYNHYGLFSMRRAARHGALTIIERGSAHILTQHEQLREEFARRGLRFPSMKWPLEQKHVQEYEEADHIIVCSDYVKRTMVEQGVPENKLTVIHLGVDLETFRPQPDKNEDGVFRVMFAGAISLQKGIPYLLEAFKGLDVSNSELVLVGAPFPEMARILPRYDGLFRFVRGVPQHELVALYNSASVFVLPSIQDGFGMAAAEAMACGVPVIVSENVGLPIEDGQQGFVVPIRDPDAIREKLLYLYENETTRQAMGERAQAHARQFSWHNYQKRLLDLYRQLARSA